MKRKSFLKRLGMSSVALPLLISCSTDEDPTSDTDTDSGKSVRRRIDQFPGSMDISVQIFKKQKQKKPFSI